MLGYVRLICNNELTMGKKRKHYYEVCVNNGSMYAHDSRSSARQAFKALGLDGCAERQLFNLVWRFLKKHPQVRTHSRAWQGLAVQIWRVEHNGY